MGHGQSILTLDYNPPFFGHVMPTCGSLCLPYEYGVSVWLDDCVCMLSQDHIVLPGARLGAFAHNPLLEESFLFGKLGLLHRGSEPNLVWRKEWYINRPICVQYWPCVTGTDSSRASIGTNTCYFLAWSLSSTSKHKACAHLSLESISSTYAPHYKLQGYHSAPYVLGNYKSATTRPFFIQRAGQKTHHRHDTSWTVHMHCFRQTRVC